MSDDDHLGLLDEIERDLMDNKPIADVLRKVVILGGRLSSVELRDWASTELNGYETSEELPLYRKIYAPLQADGSLERCRRRV